MRHPIYTVFGSRLAFLARIALFNLTAHELHELYYDRPASYRGIGQTLCSFEHVSHVSQIQFILITDRQPHPTLCRRWPSFFGRRCSRLEQSAWACHFPPSAAIFRSRIKKPTCLTFLTLPPCDCTVPAQWRLVALDTIIVLAYLLTYLLFYYILDSLKTQII